MTPNLYDVAAEAAARWGGREFLVMGLRREVLSFSELSRRADRFGRMLAGLGVRPGDRVALAMANSADWAVAAYGIARAGAITVGVSTRLTAREAAHIVSLTQATLAIVDDDVRGRNLVDELHAAGLRPDGAAGERERPAHRVDARSAARWQAVEAGAPAERLLHVAVPPGDERLQLRPHRRGREEVQGLRAGCISRS